MEDGCFVIDWVKPVLAKFARNNFPELLIQVCTGGGQSKDGGGSLEGSARDLSKLELNISDSKNNNNKTLKNMTRFTIGEFISVSSSPWKKLLECFGVFCRSLAKKAVSSFKPPVELGSILATSLGVLLSESLVSFEMRVQYSWATLGWWLQGSSPFLIVVAQWKSTGLQIMLS